MSLNSSVKRAGFMIELKMHKDKPHCIEIQLPTVN